MASARKKRGVAPERDGRRRKPIDIDKVDLTALWASVEQLHAAYQRAGPGRPFGKYDSVSVHDILVATQQALTKFDTRGDDPPGGLFAVGARVRLPDAVGMLFDAIGAPGEDNPPNPLRPQAAELVADARRIIRECVGVASSDEPTSGRHETVDCGMDDAMQRSPPLDSSEAERGSGSSDAGDPRKPSWNKETCELSFRGKVIRKVAPRAENCIRVLSSFEELGWPKRLDDPLPDGPDAKRVHDTCDTLNDLVAPYTIRFRPGGDGKSFKWLESNEGRATP